MSRCFPFVFLGLLGAGVVFAEPKSAAGIPVEGFRQILNRGDIPAIFDPDFLPAERARIPDDAWILGFEHQGRAYAYDLNLLNHHEVVNHTSGDLPIAAVW